MRVIFFAQSLPQFGVNNKIKAQVAFLKKFDLDVHHVIIGGKTTDSDLPLDIESIPVKDNFLDQITRYYAISKILWRLISSLQKNDIMYIRSLAPNPFTWIAFRRPRRSKIIIEYQTIELYEAELSFQKYRFFLMDFLFGRLTRKNNDAIVGVTDEITCYELKKTNDPKKPHITIGNGFDVNSVPIQNAKSDTSTELHVLCVANVSRWHGLDRLLKGMVHYNGNTRIILHIAGEGAELPLLRQLAEKLNLSSQVIFHRFKTGEDLDKLFNTCHIAVGSLGIHRKGLTQTSELKAREYCARGIPYIIACSDPDFPDDFPYIHRVPPDESPIDIENIIDFARTMYGDADHPQKMRAYALKYLDWSVKMKKLKIFLESLVSEPEFNNLIQ